ncbi:MAG: PepSY-associated TM helix domain-containing protein [Panacagrimonas sp.]
MAVAGQVPAPGRLYRRLWRWHFYAAFLVIPFVLMQSITGTLYLWHEEWADWAHPALRFVAPGAAAASLDEQLAAARSAHPHARPTTLLVPDDPARSTQVMFGSHHGAGDALPFPVFVDPYTARVLGTLPGWSWLPGWSRQIHGGWPLGDAGSWLLELGACWAVVMILTGLYLWWPRKRGLLAALVPRTGLGARVLVRDLHGSVAVVFSAIILVFLVSALPWTKFWGGQVLQPVQNAIGQASPFAATLQARSTPLPGVTPMGLDEAVRAARAAGLAGPLDVNLDDRPDAALSLRNRMPRSSQEVALAFDRYSRVLRVRTGWADYPAVPRAVATGVDLHEGSFFGRANQWFNTLVSLSLVWMSLTGLLSWWLRRPRGRLAAPPRTDIRLPKWALGVGTGLCLLMPMLGASVLALWGLDALLARGRAAA